MGSSIIGLAGLLVVASISAGCMSAGVRAPTPVQGTEAESGHTAGSATPATPDVPEGVRDTGQNSRQDAGQGAVQGAGHDVGQDVGQDVGKINDVIRPFVAPSSGKIDAKSETFSTSFEIASLENYQGSSENYRMEVVGEGE